MPRFLKGQGQGWITAEYACCHVLPTPVTLVKRRKESRWTYNGNPASDRPCASRGSRLKALGEFTITLDCDVLQADGARVPLRLRVPAWRWQMRYRSGGKRQAENQSNERDGSRGFFGIVNGEAICDLEYVEDSAARPT